MSVPPASAGGSLIRERVGTGSDRQMESRDWAIGPDRPLHSSATLFASVDTPDSVFGQIIEKYFAGIPDKTTLTLAGINAGSPTSE